MGAWEECLPLRASRVERKRQGVYAKSRRCGARELFPSLLGEESTDTQMLAGGVCCPGTHAPIRVLVGRQVCDDGEKSVVTCVIVMVMVANLCANLCFLPFWKLFGTVRAISTRTVGGDSGPNEAQLVFLHGMREIRLGR